MLRFLIVSLLLSLLVYMIYVKLFKTPAQPQKPAPKSEQFKKTGDSVMVACAKCGTFAESLESIAVDGKFF